MVILSVHNSADIYGASRCLVRLLGLFVEDGHRVHVVLPCSGPLVKLLEERRITVHILSPLAIIERSELRTGTGKLLFFYKCVLSTVYLGALIIRIKADVVHTNSAVLPTSALAAKLTGRRSVWHMREFFAEFPALWKVFQYYMWLLSNRIITISQAVEQQFAPSLRGRCSLVYDGLDDAAMEFDPGAAQALRSACGDPKWLIGVIGRIKFLRKGQEVLVRAAALLADRFPEIRYVIVGSTAAGNEDHLVRLKDLMRECGVEDRFHFTGDAKDTRSVYAALDVTVVPSVHPEPFGCVVMESMAIGVPVVGSRCGGIPEQVVDGETGLLFAPGDAAGLAHGITLLVNNEKDRLEMGRAGQARFREVFGIAETYRRMAEIFDGVPRPGQPVSLPRSVSVQ